VLVNPETGAKNYIFKDGFGTLRTLAKKRRDKLEMFIEHSPKPPGQER